MKKLLLSLLLVPLLAFAGTWSGSGFFISTNGHIATANHVITHAKTLTVIYNGQSYIATVLANDEDNDVAIIKINAINTPSYQINLKIDENPIYALGYPLGSKLTITKGYYLDGVDDYHVNLYVCHGNSGGVLVNEGNQAIGVVHAIRGVARNQLCSYASYAINIKYIVKLATKISLLLDIQYVSLMTYNRAEIKQWALNTNSVVYIEGED